MTGACVDRRFVGQITGVADTNIEPRHEHRNRNDPVRGKLRFASGGNAMSALKLSARK